MALYRETKIEEALLNRLNALTFTPAIPIAWIGHDFTPPTGPWLRPTLLPVPTVDPTIKLNHPILGGIFQISVYNKPTADLEPKRLYIATKEIAAAVVNWFEQERRLEREGVTVCLDEPPWIAPAIQDEGWLQLPVSVPYASYN